MTQRTETKVHACPRCGGAVCYTEPDEPFCLNCGHRTAWSSKPSPISSGMGNMVDTNPKGGFNYSYRGGRPGRLKTPQSQTVTIELADGDRGVITYVALMKRYATFEDLAWTGRKLFPTYHQAAEISRLFLKATGLKLTDFHTWHQAISMARGGARAGA